MTTARRAAPSSTTSPPAAPDASKFTTSDPTGLTVGFMPEASALSHLLWPLIIQSGVRSDLFAVDRRHRADLRGHVVSHSLPPPRSTGRHHHHEPGRS